MSSTTRTHRARSTQSAHGALPHGLDRIPLLIVSPHADDAALSCAALLARREPLDVATVFTGRPSPPQVTEWDRATGFADSDAAMGARMAEERAAFDGSPHRLHALGGLDGQYLEGPRRSRERSVIGSFVRSWVREAGPDGRVVAPVGAGRRRRLPGPLERRMGRGPRLHPDHEWVRDAVLAATHPGLLLLYEEFPYLLGRRGDRAAARIARRSGRRAEAVDLRVDVARKRARLAAYASQLGALTVDDDPLPATERHYRLVREEEPARR